MQKETAQTAAPNPQKKQIDDARLALRHLEYTYDWSPRELYEMLDNAGYAGQEQARQRLCLMAYRHIRRLKDHFLCNMPLEQLPQKSNVLMMGPTGCGKSHLAQLLFGKLLNIPVVTVDMTGFVETGYCGRQVSEILNDLVTAAEGNLFRAKMGICILDEFDKIAGSGSNLRFGGAGTKKDVSGFGVQRGLLKMIEGGSHPLTNKPPWSPQEDNAIETDCISFVACGAFSGIEELLKNEHTNTFGFRSHKRSSEATYDNPVSVDILNRYGFIPELIGRFGSIAHLQPLGKQDLMQILKQNVLPRYKQEFKREGQRLLVPKKVMEKIVEKALERRTGARGITLLLTEYFEKKAFECFGGGLERNLEYPSEPF